MRVLLLQFLNLLILYFFMVDPPKTNRPLGPPRSRGTLRSTSRGVSRSGSRAGTAASRISRGSGSSGSSRKDSDTVDEDG